MMNLSTMLQGMADDRPAKQLIKKWKHDEDSLRFWRASSNFVYVFTREGKRQFLRFIHASDNSAAQIEAELDFIVYLAANGYPAAKPVASVHGRWLERMADEELGVYYGVAFEQAEGSHVPLGDMSAEQLFGWGRSLARLHELSAGYAPDAGRPERWGWRDVMAWTYEVLERHREGEALREWNRVQAWLESLPADGNHVGLIHYDFQPDNVFDRGVQGDYGVIDFDDAMQHWFAADIAAALGDLDDFSDPETRAIRDIFIRGYTSARPLGISLEETFAGFRRFDRLYGFARIIRSMERVDEASAPEWMKQLLAKFRGHCDRRRGWFQEAGSF
ncbi:phosphotransferase enzyme family protein [Paenibacillus sacheonensis]|uniref:Phosphotransferase n=1 Tax=Paenibacillus sacheonensis TaxID=742054 RepID=A0A7X4YPB8_9BACL|nr:phosphotransferase [Paenibacillus sacheonensis]MBM7565226.1 Ser/Thr protein kinase RdoA (MazF antagonist) [Paenibacillus sacheonensis]NBC69998.1 phosphotransferase [Paenibacillus sacheonensis]